MNRIFGDRHVMMWPKAKRDGREIRIVCTSLKSRKRSATKLLMSRVSESTAKSNVLIFQMCSLAIGQNKHKH